MCVGFVMAAADGHSGAEIAARIDRGGNIRDYVRDLRDLDDSTQLLIAASVVRAEKAKQILCDVFGFRHDSAGLDFLFAQANSDASHVRAAALDAIGKVFGYTSTPPVDRLPQASAVLAAAWQSESDIEVRRTLPAAMGLLRDPALIPLVREARVHDDTRVRRQAEWAATYLADRGIFV